MTRTERVAMIDRGRADLSVWRQCALLGLARSGLSRQPAVADAEELALMRWIDEQHLATPFVACPSEGRGLTADDGGAAPMERCVLMKENECASKGIVAEWFVDSAFWSFNQGPSVCRRQPARRLASPDRCQQ